MSITVAFKKPGQQAVHERFTDLKEILGNDDVIIVR